MAYNIHNGQEHMQFVGIAIKLTFVLLFNLFFQILRIREGEKPSLAGKKSKLD